MRIDDCGQGRQGKECWAGQGRAGQMEEMINKPASSVE